MKPMIILSVILLSLAGCRYACKNPLIYCLYNGYDSSELSIVIISKYQRTTPSFTNLLARNISGTSVDTSIPGTDTVAGMNQQFTINPDYDYTIEMPSTGQLFKLHDFSISTNHQSAVGGVRENCANTIHYYYNDTAKDETPGAQPSDNPKPLLIILRR